MLLACHGAGAARSVAPTVSAFPAFTDWVVDDAALLPPRARLAVREKCRRLQRITGRQLAVVTVRSLGGRPIEAYGLALANVWGVGRKGIDDGVVLLFAPREHAIRIEVGRGLERTLTNADTKAIIDRSILPRFRAGDVPGGIARGVDAIIQELSLPERKAA